MLMMYINLPVQGHIQKFTKETVLMPPWLVRKSKNKQLMTNEKEKAANHNKHFCFSFELEKQKFIKLSIQIYGLRNGFVMSSISFKTLKK